MARISSHVIETRAKDCIQDRIDSFGEVGDFLFRELSGRDYGVDGILECFDNGVPTGKIAYLQIKGTSTQLVPLKNKKVISCSGVSVSNLSYVKQNRISVILIYVSLLASRPMFFADLKEISKDITYDKNLKHVTVHIPIENCAIDDISPIVEIVNRYYE